MNRKERIRWTLGDPANYVPQLGDKADLITYALDCGIEPVAVHAMSFVDLVNVYHGNAPAATGSDVQHETARAVLATLAAVTDGGVTEATIRAIARQELASQPPRRLEVVTPTGSIILDGLVHYRTEMVIRIVALGHPVMLVGPAGCGKTTIGEQTARALQLAFYITSTINDTHELLGFVDGYGKYHATPFRLAFECGGLWIADEIDAWDAAALLAANSALANGYATFPDRERPIARHSEFRMVATANTFGSGADRVYVGRNELDAASLDRFATIDVDYDTTLEQAFAGDQKRWLDRVWSVRKAVEENKIRHVVSSRAIGMGATALAAGLSWDDVERIYLMKGLSKRDQEKIL